jgi:putative membrane protein
VATLFLIVAIFVYWSAEVRARQTHQRLTARMAEPTATKNFRAICILLTLATLGVGGVLWML